MDITTKIANLLRLAESDNPHEAELAAKRAQELMSRHHITEAMLSEHGGIDEAPEDAVIDEWGKAITWKGQLAQGIAKVNGGTVYYGSRRGKRTLHVVATPGDRAVIEYLYAHVAGEVERFSRREGRGRGRTWANNFRLGMVARINERLLKARQATEEAMRGEASAASSTALVRVNDAIAKVNARRGAAERWADVNLKLRAARSYAARDHGAYEAGRRAGDQVGLNKGIRQGAVHATLK
jgi:hypothetical protein